MRLIRGFTVPIPDEVKTECIEKLKTLTPAEVRRWAWEKHGLSISVSTIYKWKNGR